MELEGATIVVAHEQLGGEQAAAGAVAQAGGQVALQVEGDEVGLAAGGEVGLVSYPQEEVVGTAQGRVFRRVEKPSGLEGSKATAPVLGEGHPEHRTLSNIYYKTK